MTNKTYFHKSMRLVALMGDIDKGTITQLHVVRVKLMTGKVSATACGIVDAKGYQFPFHNWIWSSDTAPVCEACYQKVAGKVRWS